MPDKGLDGPSPSQVDAGGRVRSATRYRFIEGFPGDIPVGCYSSASAC